MGVTTLRSQPLPPPHGASQSGRPPGGLLPKAEHETMATLRSFDVGQGAGTFRGATWPSGVRTEDVEPHPLAARQRIALGRRGRPEGGPHSCGDPHDVRPMTTACSQDAEPREVGHPSTYPSHPRSGTTSTGTSCPYPPAPCSRSSRAWPTPRAGCRGCGAQPSGVRSTRVSGYTSAPNR